MPSWTGWALAAVVLLVAVVAVWRSRGPSVLKAGARLIEQWHERTVAAHRKRLSKLKEDATRNADKINRLEAKLAAAKQRLAVGYADQRLSAEEIANRFRSVPPSRSDRNRGTR